MKVLSQPISLKELDAIAKARFGNLVKAVVDIEKSIMVIDAELHADEEAMLLEQGSSQKDVWGINLYPSIQDESWIEFDSMINLRPSLNNLTRGVTDPKIQEKIRKVVQKLIIR